MAFRISKEKFQALKTKQKQKASTHMVFVISIIKWRKLYTLRQTNVLSNL